MCSCSCLPLASKHVITCSPHSHGRETLGTKLVVSHTLSISAAYFLACLLSMNPSTLVLSQSTRSEPEAQKHRRITQLKHHDQGVYQQHSEYEAYIKYMSKVNQLTQCRFSVFSLWVSNPIYILAFRVSSRKKSFWWGGGGGVFRNYTAKVPCDFLVGVAHCTLLISEHQASSGAWLKLY